MNVSNPIRMLALLAILSGSVVQAAEVDKSLPRNKAEQEAAALVKEALHQDLVGNSEKRAELLAKAEKLAPDFEPVQWAKGNIRVNGKWIKATEVGGVTSKDTRLKAYDLKRRAAENTLEGNLKLADWCADSKLVEQERAHLARVLELEPNNTIARQKLGFINLNGRWVLRQTLVDSAKQAEKDSVNLRTWGPKILELVNRIENGSSDVREKAKKDLLASTDEGALIALEVVACSRSEETAKIAIQAMSDVANRQAATLLARQSIISEWASVRDAAAKGLKNCAQPDYVPALLAELQIPVRSITQVIPTGGRSLLYRELLVSENQDAQNIVVRDTNYVAPIQNTVTRDNQRAVQRDIAVNNEIVRLASTVNNMQQEELNRRICKSLSTATGESIQNDPAAWWSWWNDQNGIEIQGPKQQFVNVQQRQVEVGQQVPVAGGSQGGSQSGSQQPARHECLAAGTMIMTNQGLKPVESLAIGDMVVAQDIDSGEIQLKAVLKTTVRNASQLINISVGNEVITASAGHPFWIVGEGWKMASELQTGMEIHSMQGPQRISKIEKGTFDRSYNLIVSDFASYFIGPNMLLSHDNTMREAVHEAVPGVAGK